MSTIVITRPKGDGAILAEELHARGHHVVHEPLMEIFLHHNERHTLERLLRDDPDAIIITSRHGVQALFILTELRDLPLLCVGEATAQEALSAGFTRVHAAGGNAQSVIDTILAGYDEGSRLLYLCGAHTRVDMDAELSSKGMKVDRLVVYEAVAAEQLSDTLVEHMRRGQVDAVTFFSPRTAQIFTELLAKANAKDLAAHLHAVCLSEAVAQPLRALTWKSINAAQEAMLASVADCVDNIL